MKKIKDVDVLQMGTFFLLLLMTIRTVLSYINYNTIGLVVTINLIIYITLFLMIIILRESLSELNISWLSIILLIGYPTTMNLPSYTSSLRIIIQLANSLIVIIFLFFFIRFNDKCLEKISGKLFLFFLFGFVIGVSIAIIKIKFGNLDLVNLALENPTQYLFALPISLSYNIVGQEILFRGLLWGYLDTKGINSKAKILLTSFVWVIIIFSSQTSLSEVIGLFLIGIILGFLVNKTKSVDMSISTYAGYISFLVFQQVFL